MKNREEILVNFEKTGKICVILGLVLKNLENITKNFKKNFKETKTKF